MDERWRDRDEELGAPVRSIFVMRSTPLNGKTRLRLMKGIALMWVFILLPMLGACGAPERGHPPRSGRVASALELYICGEGQFLFLERSQEGEVATVRYGATVERLRRQGVGGRAQGETLIFVEDLGGARLEAPDGSFRCHQNERTRELEALIENDLRFFGFGNEPSIALYLFDDRFILSLEEGQREMEGAVEILTVDASRSARISLESEDVPLILSIAAASCKDSMSGAHFSHRFALQIGERLLSGCGFGFGLPPSVDSSGGGESRVGK